MEMGLYLMELECAADGWPLCG